MAPADYIWVAAICLMQVAQLGLLIWLIASGGKITPQLEDLRKKIVTDFHGRTRILINLCRPELVVPEPAEFIPVPEGK